MLIQPTVIIGQHLLGLGWDLGWEFPSASTIVCFSDPVRNETGAGRVRTEGGTQPPGHRPEGG